MKLRPLRRGCCLAAAGSLATRLAAGTDRELTWSVWTSDTWSSDRWQGRGDFAIFFKAALELGYNPKAIHFWLVPAKLAESTHQTCRTCLRRWALDGDRRPETAELEGGGGPAPSSLFPVCVLLSSCLCVIPECFSTLKVAESSHSRRWLLFTAFFTLAEPASSPLLPKHQQKHHKWLYRRVGLGLRDNIVGNYW